MPAENRSYTALTAVLICLASLIARSDLRAQNPSTPHPPITIAILDGEGALNDIRQRTAREPIVEVDDENHKPIAGAAVLFLLPSSGPSGTFADGTRMLTMMTDSAGRVAIQGMRPNGVSGSFEIHVRATYNGSTAETTIHQKNVSGNTPQSENNNASAASGVPANIAHGLSAKSLLLIIGGAAAAGAIAAVALTRGSNSTTVTAGPPTIGPPSGTIVKRNIITFPLRRHRR